MTFFACFFRCRGLLLSGGLIMLLSSCAMQRNAAPARVEAGSVRAMRVGAGELTAEDLAGILALRYTKFQIPASSNGLGWDMRVVLERAGEPARTLHTYGLGDAMPPFLVAYDWSRPTAAESTLYLAHVWHVTHPVLVPQPRLTPNMRSSATPIREGRTVIVLWTNTGGGWDPGDANFTQRIVVDLKSRVRQQGRR